MSKLTLRSGRFIPRTAREDLTARIALLEGYLATLTEELERILDDIDRTLEAARGTTLPDGGADS